LILSNVCPTFMPTSNTGPARSASRRSKAPNTPGSSSPGSAVPGRIRSEYGLAVPRRKAAGLLRGERLSDASHYHREGVSQSARVSLPHARSLDQIGVPRLRLG
jgi:hypothetical protein